MTSSSSSPRRVLVVADEACDFGGLCGLVRERAGMDSEVIVVAPALTRSRLRFWASDIDAARLQAKKRLGATVASLEALGIEARGSVGDPDPVQAVDDVLREFAADEVLVFAHPREASSWLERDVVPRLRERYGLPVEQIVVVPDTQLWSARRRSGRARPRPVSECRAGGVSGGFSSQRSS